MKINILEPSVYNRIAAGEVVENPASAVKELVENSIDAGATKINVAIAQGGIKSIEVTDDGCGIEKEELYKTILPHATGKITTASDLDSIATLGFRGEALASIAAVSEIEIKSKYMSAECGAKLTAKGGENVTIDDIAYNQGTSILISNLFYNTPVRFKFLKSVRTEESYVTKTMFQLILANPHIAIKYEADGKQVYLSDGSGQENAIKTVFSADISQNMLAMKEDFTQPIRVSGYISSPSLYKSNRNLQTFILNGRVVTDPNISAAVNNAYGGRLMQHNFPVFVINVLMRFDEVDINVHPNKREVRFANPRQVYGAIYHAVKNTLEAYEQEADEEFRSMAMGRRNETLAAGVDSGAITLEKNEEEKTQHILPYTDTPTVKNASYTVAYYLDKLERQNKDGTSKVAENVDFSIIKDVFSPNNTIWGLEENKSEAISTKYGPQPEPFSHSSINYKVIGQVFNTYLVLEYQEKVYFIDQHAAHERLLYDKLKKERDHGQVVSQPLLIPYIYEDTPVNISEILSLIPEINQLGFELEPFGNNTLKINAVPQILTDIDPAKFLAEIKESIQCRDFSQGDFVREKLMQKACKSAIKGGYSYNNEQSDQIIKYFIENGMPLQCPHGRPTYITFSKNELEKMFRRIL